jgi:predicted ABC-type ATPase
VTVRPQLWVFAGPNGGGKSTLVERFHVADGIPVVNPDVIASRLDPAHKGEPAIMLRAGKVAASERRRLLASGLSFGIETTLTGHSELRLMNDARVVGHKVTLVFVGVNDALTSLARVRERVARGGHDVPAPIVLRRYYKSLENLPAAIGFADRSFIVDNREDRHRLLVTIDDSRIRYLSRRLPDWATKLISGGLLRAFSDRSE